MISRLIFTSVLILTTTACSSSDSGSAGDPFPRLESGTGSAPVSSPGHTSKGAETERQRFDTLYQAYSNHLATLNKYECNSITFDCESVPYPQLANELSEARQTLKELNSVLEFKAQFDENQFFVSGAQNIEKGKAPRLQTLIAKLTGQVGAIEQKLQTSVDQFARIRKNREAAEAALTQDGTCHVDDLGLVTCDSQIITLNDARRHLKQRHLMQEYGRWVKAEDDLNKSFPSPGLQPDAGFESRMANYKASVLRVAGDARCRSDVELLWKKTQDRLTSAVQEQGKNQGQNMALDSGDYFEKVRDSLTNRICDEAAANFLEQQIDIVDRFSTAFVNSAAGLTGKVFDRLVLGTQFQKYTDNAYNFAPDSNEGLIVTLPVGADEKILSGLYDQLDRAGNDKWNTRARLIAAVNQEIHQFPKDFPDKPFHLKVKATHGWYAFFKERKLADVLLHLQNGVKEWANRIQVQNSLVKFSGYQTPDEVTVTIVIGDLNHWECVAPINNAVTYNDTYAAICLLGLMDFYKK